MLEDREVKGCVLPDVHEVTTSVPVARGIRTGRGLEVAVLALPLLLLNPSNPAIFSVMTIETEGAACSCYFETRHEVHTRPAMRALERDVLGCDFGGTSWTTQSQADEIPPTLDLNSSSHLLEIGAGTGWPSLYVAKAASCRVTLVDILVSALGSAQKRARLEGMEQLLSLIHI